MAYVNPLDAATPAATDPVSQGDDRIRESKAALIERLLTVFVDLSADPLIVRDVATGTLTPSASTKDLGASGTAFRDLWLSRTATITQGPITADTKAISSSVTWNNAAVTFTHWTASITDTASNAASKIAEFFVGGVSQFALTKAGKLTLASGLASAFDTPGANWLDLAPGANNYVMNRLGYLVTMSLPAGSGQTAMIGANWVFDYSGDFRYEYIYTEAAQQIRFSNNRMEFHVAPPGALAGNAITWQAAMYIDAATSGGIPTVSILGSLTLAASVAARAPLRIPHGTAPSSPTNGDIWTTTAGVFARINGATVGPLT